MGPAYKLSQCILLSLFVGMASCGDGDSSSSSPQLDGGSGAAGAGGSGATGGTGGTGATGGSAGTGTGGSAGNGAAGQGGGPIIEDAPSTSHEYEDDHTVFENPERGFYSTANMMKDTSLSWVRQRGHTLVFSYVRLDDVREEPISAAMIEAMDKGFDLIRDAGLKLILRFSYNFGPYPNSEPDAPKSWVIHHIGQIQPLLAKHEDVILLVQAGFIGAWGEWHSSTNGLLDQPEDRREILEALLQATPAHRMTQLRYPAYKLEMFGDPVGPSEAFDGSDKARVGHHNDCFLASDTDMGTYVNRGDVPPLSLDEWKAYVAQDTRYLPMGGETCQVSPRSGCPTALAEMEMLHFSYINEGYHPDVVASWESCRLEMERRLGYRFHLSKASFPQAVRPGGAFRLQVRVHNDGWARVFNARPLIVVLRGASSDYEVELEQLDVRQWGPGETTQVGVRLGLPADIAVGNYTLAIRLPDAATGLRDRPIYSIRMAGGATWNGQTGDNELSTVQVDDHAPGTADTTATVFRVLSYD